MLMNLTKVLNKSYEYFLGLKSKDIKNSGLVQVELNQHFKTNFLSGKYDKFRLHEVPFRENFILSKICFEIFRGMISSYETKGELYAVAEIIATINGADKKNLDKMLNAENMKLVEEPGART